VSSPEVRDGAKFIEKIRLQISRVWQLEQASKRNASTPAFAPTSCRQALGGE